MEKELVVNEDEMIEFIHTKLNVNKETIVAVLDLEFEYLKQVGVIEE